MHPATPWVSTSMVEKWGRYKTLAGVALRLKLQLFTMAELPANASRHRISAAGSPQVFI